MCSAADCDVMHSYTPSSDQGVRADQSFTRHTCSLSGLLKEFSSSSGFWKTCLTLNICSWYQWSPQIAQTVCCDVEIQFNRWTQCGACRGWLRLWVLLCAHRNLELKPKHSLNCLVGLCRSPQFKCHKKDTIFTFVNHKYTTFKSQMK